MSKNISKSIKQKLLNYARKENVLFNELLQYFVMERVLYRLSKSKYKDEFILKGGLMFHIWQGYSARPTMDIDFLGKFSNNQVQIKDKFIDILGLDIDDGISFDYESIKLENILKNIDYAGTRVSFTGVLDTTKFKIKIDIGFNDIVLPKCIKENFSGVLNDINFNLRCYTKETALAEKFETIIQKGMINSRMKDYYDIWILLNEFNIDRTELKNVILEVLKNRKTDIPDEIEALSDGFADLKKNQWISFCKKIKDDKISKDFNLIIMNIKQEIYPILNKSF